MTPETRAARDRLAAFLDTWERIAGEPAADTLMTLTALEPPTGRVALTRSDLRAVLAALDQQPTGIIAAPPDVTDEQLAAFREAWDEARYGPVRIERLPDPDAEEEPHRLTVRLIPHRDINGVDQGLQPHRELHHTAACDRLPYGQICVFDSEEGPGGADDRPAEPGEYEGHYWAGKYWTDAGWEYDAGIQWQRAEPEEPKP